MKELMNDEKHYITLNNYLRSIYNEKVFKISLNGNFSCPNRDGKISTKGCLFCSSLGSGDFAGERTKPIKLQFEEIKEVIEKKWKEGSYIAYFQANTNTYGTVDELRERFEQIFNPDGTLINDKIKILSIATRPDCIDDEILDYLTDLSKRINLWIELGFQTSNEDTAEKMNRGYKNQVLVDTVNKLAERNITTIIHIINGLPGDTYQDMLNTVKFLSVLPINGIKIHMLHVIKNAPLGKMYLDNPFPLLSLQEYVDIVIEQLRLLPTNIVIHRITGDADRNEIIEPIWTLKKFVVMDEIDKKMRKENYYQGDKIEVKN